MMPLTLRRTPSCVRMHPVTLLTSALHLYSFLNLSSGAAAKADLIPRNNTALQPQAPAQASGANTSLACIDLDTASRGHVFYPGSDVYQYENQNFWSLTEILSPSCVFRPTSAQEIGDAIKILESTNTKFAVRGGGHMGITVCSRSKPCEQLTII